ncbi:MAG: chorismate-binding protein [Vampirovibrionales bacterium]|nr:chorismate-binding protein [Vampirovibrionales bacterium]
MRVRSWTSDVETPVSLFARLSANESHAFLLDSNEGDSRLARFSFIGIRPSRIFEVKNGKARLITTSSGNEQYFNCDDPFAWLAAQQKLTDAEIAARQALLAQSMPLPWEGTLPFTGGWVGITGFGATQYTDAIAPKPCDPLQVPDLIYGEYHEVLIVDHRLRRTFWLCDLPDAEADTRWRDLMAALAQPAQLPVLALDAFAEKTSDADWIFNRVEASMDKAAFCEAVEQTRQWITEGQVFQLVLAQRYSLRLSDADSTENNQKTLAQRYSLRLSDADNAGAECELKTSPAHQPSQAEITLLDAQALQTYRVLQAISPTPYGYWLKFNHYHYIGASPETFVSCQQQQVKLRALAGTRYRGKTQADDARLAYELCANVKELAEHRMLVDLDRNDLGRCCKPGSIQVGQIAALTRYTHVMHLTTDISGELADDKTPLDLFSACLPRGTVSGAPKIRAMQLINQLEPECRGFYSGVVGYFGADGNMDGAIAIRSVLLQPGWAHVHAGAGIVFDSIAEQEYLETRNKAKSTLAAVQIAMALAESPENLAMQPA